MPRKNSINPASPNDSIFFEERSMEGSNAELFRSTPAKSENIADRIKPVKKVKKFKPRDSPRKAKLKNFLRFFFKKFGMLIVTVIYCIGGALLFNILEGQNELAGCEGSASDMNALITDTKLKIFNYLNFNVTFNPELTKMTETNDTVYLDGIATYNAVIEKMLIEFRDEVLANGYGGEVCEDVNSWQFLSGLLWTMTVVTSIGYGHTSPSTWEGQICLFCYALLGMPLFLMTLAEISVMLADMFVFVYQHVFCCPCNLYSHYKIMKEDDQSQVKVDSENPAAMSCEDDFYAQTNSKMAFSDGTDFNPKPKIMDVDEEIGGGEEGADEVRVPMVIIMGTLIGFLIGCGNLFNYLEDWDVVVGVYFTYISITTVGFGDYSPGTADMGAGKSLRAGRNLLFGTVTIVIGMAIMGMCFSLMADGLVENFTNIAMGLGCMKEKDDDGEVYIGSDDDDEDDIDPKEVGARQAIIQRPGKKNKLIKLDSGSSSSDSDYDSEEEARPQYHE